MQYESRLQQLQSQLQADAEASAGASGQSSPSLSRDASPERPQLGQHRSLSRLGTPWLAQASQPLLTPHESPAPASKPISSHSLPASIPSSQQLTLRQQEHTASPASRRPSTAAAASRAPSMHRNAGPPPPMVHPPAESATSSAAKHQQLPNHPQYLPPSRIGLWRQQMPLQSCNAAQDAISPQDEIFQRASSPALDAGCPPTMHASAHQPHLVPGTAASSMRPFSSSKIGLYGPHGMRSGNLEPDSGLATGDWGNQSRRSTLPEMNQDIHEASTEHSHVQHVESSENSPQEPYSAQAKDTHPHLQAVPGDQARTLSRSALPGAPQDFVTAEKIPSGFLQHDCQSHASPQEPYGRQTGQSDPQTHSVSGDAAAHLSRSSVSGSLQVSSMHERGTQPSRIQYIPEPGTSPQAFNGGQAQDLDPHLALHGALSGSSRRSTLLGTQQTAHDDGRELHHETAMAGAALPAAAFCIAGTTAQPGAWAAGCCQQPPSTGAADGQQRPHQQPPQAPQGMAVEPAAGQWATALQPPAQLVTALEQHTSSDAWQPELSMRDLHDHDEQVPATLRGSHQLLGTSASSQQLESWQADAHCSPAPNDSSCKRPSGEEWSPRQSGVGAPDLWSTGAPQQAVQQLLAQQQGASQHCRPRASWQHSHSLHEHLQLRNRPSNAPNLVLSPEQHQHSSAPSNMEWQPPSLPILHETGIYQHQPQLDNPPTIDPCPSGPSLPSSAPSQAAADETRTAVSRAHSMQPQCRTSQSEPQWIPRAVQCQNEATFPAQMQAQDSQGLHVLSRRPSRLSGQPDLLDVRDPPAETLALQQEQAEAQPLSDLGYSAPRNEMRRLTSSSSMRQEPTPASQDACTLDGQAQPGTRRRTASQGIASPADIPAAIQLSDMQLRANESQNVPKGGSAAGTGSQPLEAGMLIDNSSPNHAGDPQPLSAQGCRPEPLATHSKPSQAEQAQESSSTPQADMARLQAAHAAALLELHALQAAKLR